MQLQPARDAERHQHQGRVPGAWCATKSDIHIVLSFGQQASPLNDWLPSSSPLPGHEWPASIPQDYHNNSYHANKTKTNKIRSSRSHGYWDVLGHQCPSQQTHYGRKRGETSGQYSVPFWHRMLVKLQRPWMPSTTQGHRAQKKLV